MKQAFTLIELVFVIVVISILAATIIPNTKTNTIESAALQLAADIRYTQHLALIDDRYHTADMSKSNNEIKEWVKSRWQLIFYSGNNADKKIAYTIFSDSGTYSGDASRGEIALSPQNSNQVMSGGFSGSSTLDIRDKNSFVGMRNMNLGKTYSIDSIAFQDGCINSAHITFDNLGRPMTGTHGVNNNSHSYIKSNCRIILKNSTKEIAIVIAPETGYIEIEF